MQPLSCVRCFPEYIESWFIGKKEKWFWIDNSPYLLGSTKDFPEKGSKSQKWVRVPRPGQQGEKHCCRERNNSPDAWAGSKFIFVLKCPAQNWAQCSVKKYFLTKYCPPIECLCPPTRNFCYKGNPPPPKRPSVISILPAVKQMTLV